MQIPGSSSLPPPFGSQKTQGAAAPGFFTTEPEPATGAKAEFLKRALMSFAEQMRASILEAMGLDEEKLKAMSGEEREKIEAKIRETMKARIEEDQKEKTGLFVDLKV